MLYRDITLSKMGALGIYIFSLIYNKYIPSIGAGADRAIGMNIDMLNLVVFL